MRMRSILLFSSSADIAGGTAMTMAVAADFIYRCCAAADFRECHFRNINNTEKYYKKASILTYLGGALYFILAMAIRPSVASRYFPSSK